MKGYVASIEELSVNNKNFRQVLYTAAHSQLVVMSLNPGEEIGEEVHDVDQFLRVETGVGRAVLDGQAYDIKDGWAVVVPAEQRHNIINTSQSEPMKLYTIYSPAHHKDGVVHKTKDEAEKDEEHFDGKTTE